MMIRSHLVLVIMGLPGTGKSTLAMKLAGLLPCQLIRSDELREQLGLRGAYNMSTRSKVYRELESRVHEALDEGKAVIVDATFSEPDWQVEFQQGMLQKGIHPVWVLCEAPDEVLRQRLCGRRPLSDADGDVYDELARGFNTNVPCYKVNTHELSVEEQAREVIEELGMQIPDMNSA